MRRFTWLSKHCLFVLMLTAIPVYAAGIQDRPAQTTPIQPPTVSLLEANEHLLDHPKALYPPIAKAAHEYGKVLVGVEVDADGNVTQAIALDGYAMLRQAAIDAVLKWKFRPFEVHGTVAVVRTAVWLNFGAYSNYGTWVKK
ncbi:MAG TPA: energy transducer TonB [Acidobacteriaceae bacterium]